MEITVEWMDAEDLFSYRWHPYAVNPKIDYSTECALAALAGLALWNPG